MQKQYCFIFILHLIFWTYKPLTAQDMQPMPSVQKKINFFVRTIAYYKDVYERYQKYKIHACSTQEEAELHKDLYTLRNQALFAAGSFIALGIGITTVWLIYPRTVPQQEKPKPQEIPQKVTIDVAEESKKQAELQRQKEALLQQEKQRKQDEEARIEREKKLEQERLEQAKRIADEVQQKKQEDANAASKHQAALEQQQKIAEDNEAAIKKSLEERKQKNERDVEEKRKKRLELQARIKARQQQ